MSDASVDGAESADRDAADRDAADRDAADCGAESTDHVHDLLGVGLGPFNLGLAALVDGSEDVPLDTVFLEQKHEFTWHEGMLLRGTTLEVPFLADLVTLADPTNPYSYLNYLRERDRLYEFYFYETFQTPRREYDDYCRWVAENVENTQFARRVVDIESVEETHPTANFRVTALTPTNEDDPAATNDPAATTADDPAATTADDPAATNASDDGVNRETYLTRHLAVGVGSRPYVPEEFRGFPDDEVFHTASYRYNRDAILDTDSITVVGSGQSAAEVFQDLLNRQPDNDYRLDWMTRSDGFFPMEYSKLGLQHFTPEYTDYVYDLPQPVKDDLIPNQDLLYKGIDPETSNEIYEALYAHSVGSRDPDVGMIAMTELQDITQTAEGRYRLDCEQWQAETAFSFETDTVILGTGYHRPTPSFLSSLEPQIERDEHGRLAVQREYTLETDFSGEVFVQNAEVHTHGVGAPDLGLGTYRNAVILDRLLADSPYPVDRDTVFQDFAPEEFVRDALGGRVHADGDGDSDDRASDRDGNRANDEREPPRETPAEPPRSDD
jgi:lysine N6-hydroxylase